MQPIRDVWRREHFEWTKEADQALTYFKKIITEDLIVMWPDYSQPVYVCSDASESKKIYVKKERLLYKIILGSFGAMAYQILEIDTTQSNWKENLPTSLKATEKPVFPTSGSGVPTPFNSQDPHLVIHEFDKMNLAMKVDQDLSLSKTYHYLKPIAYYGKCFSEQQQRWNALEKETAALCSTLTNMKQLLQNFTTVYCIVDSQSLLYLLKGQQMQNNKLTRWVLQIKECTDVKYFFLHCKGKLHTLADTLSRNVFIPVVKENVYGKVNLKKPVIVASPFRSGEMVNLDQVERLLKEFPNIVYQFEEKQPQPLTIEQVKVMQKRNTTRFVNLIQSPNVKELLKYLTDEELFREQSKDPVCQEIRRILQEKKEKQEPDCEPGCMKKHQHSFFYQNSVNRLLYKRNRLGDFPDDTGRLVVPESRILVLFAMYHVNNHCGAESLASSLKGPYFFPKMHVKLRRFTLSCHYCAIFKPTKTRAQLATRPYRPVLEPNHLWWIDEVVSMQNQAGTDGFLTCIEEFTGFKVAIPLRSRKAENIAKLLEERILSVFSPSVIASDRGTNLLLSTAVNRKLKRYGVDSHVGVPYSPKSHGKVENANKQIEILVAILVDRSGEPWTKCLPYAVALLNHKPQPHMNNLSSYYMMFGTHPPVPVKPHALQGTFPDPQNMEEVWKEHHQLLQELRMQDDIAKNKIYKQRGGEKHDKFESGNLVYMMDVRLKGQNKLRPKFFRLPLKIIQTRPPVAITEDLNLTGIIRIIHYDKLRLCAQYETEAFLQLPPQVRVQLGTSFSSEEIQRLMKKENLSKLPDIYKLKPQEQLPIQTKRRVDPRIDLPQVDQKEQKEEVTLEAPYNFEDTDWFNIFDEPSAEMQALKEDNFNQQVEQQMQALNEVPIPSVDEVPKRVTFADNL